MPFSLRRRARPSCPRPASRPRQRRFVPQVENLEERATPATVTTLTDGTGPGTLRFAIANTAPGGTVNFDPALNGGTLTLTQGEVAVNHSLSIVSPGLITISGNNASRVFNVDDGSLATPIQVTLSGLRLTGGNGIGNASGSKATQDFLGGAVFNNGEDLTVTNSVISGNTVDASAASYPSYQFAAGGGVYTYGGNLTLNATVVSGNTVIGVPGERAYGGGIAQGAGPYANTVKIVGSTITGNVVQSTADSSFGGEADGGGVAVDCNCGGPAAISLVITDSTISGNRAGGAAITGAHTAGYAVGGGIWAGSNAALTMTGSTVSGNYAVGGNATESSSGFLQGGAAGGGGIYLDMGLYGAAPVVISSSTISGNAALAGSASSTAPTSRAGGGILSFAYGLVITDSIISGNRAGGGAATVTGAFIKDRTRGGPASGGGLYQAVFPGGTVKISGSTISGNVVTGGTGGGGYSSYGGAVAGAGVFINGESGGYGLQFVNSTISGNRATAGSGTGGDNLGGTGGDGYGGYAYGGGVYTTDLAPDGLTLTNVTIAFNDVTAGTGTGGSGATPGTGTNGTASGGGLFSNTAGEDALLNSLVAKNGHPGLTGPDASGAFDSQGHNLIGDGSGSTGFGAAGDQVGTAGSPIDPLLGPLQNNGGPTPTHALLPGSPALNAADPSVLGPPLSLQFDQRGPGFSRSFGGAVDIGAFERQPLATTTTLASSANPSFAGAAVAFTATVTVPLLNGGPAQGTVTFFVDGAAAAVVTLANGVASFSTSTLAVGSHTVTAQYAGIDQGSSDFLPSGASLTQVVNAVPPPAVTYVVAGADAGAPPLVNVFDASSGRLVTTILAFPSFFTGGVRVAAGDVTGDGVPDVIAGAGPGGGQEVKVFDGTTFQLVQDYYALPAFFTGGVFVAAGDVNADGFADVIVGADKGGGPQVNVFSGKDGSLVESFYAFPSFFTGGVRVGAGDVDGDGRADIIAGAGAGGLPQVSVFSGANLAVLESFFAFPTFFRGGVFVAGGDLNGDGRAEVVVGAGPGAGPQVSIFGGAGGALLGSFFAADPRPTDVVNLDANAGAGVRVGTTSVQGRGEILTTPGPGPQTAVQEFDGSSLALLDRFFAFGPEFHNGAFVGG